MKRCYFDHAATTPVAPSVIDAITSSLINDFGNVSSTNSFGQQEKLKLRLARKALATFLKADLNEIYFTSGATESNNTVIRQVALARKDEGRHLITTQVEHPSVLKVMQYLSKNGYDVTYLPVNEKGSISIADFKSALRSDTILVSIMAGNNETGSIMPIKEIGEILQGSKTWFHVDATQAFGIESINVKELKLDFLSASAHKLYGPKGIGLLFKRKEITILPLLLGGEQENKFRAGTTNLPLIIGFQEAVELCSQQAMKSWEYTYEKYKQLLVETLKNLNVDFEINGDINASLPQIINLWFKGVSSRVLLPLLDLDGFGVAAGSACTAGNEEDSHVLLAMYPNNLNRVRESIRVSFGRDNKEEDVLRLAYDISAQVSKLLRKERNVR